MVCTAVDAPMQHLPGMVDVCDGCLAAEASRYIFGYVGTVSLGRHCGQAYMPHLPRNPMLRIGPMATSASAPLNSPLPYHGCATVDATSGYAWLYFILCSFDLACPCCVPYVEATVFGVDASIGIDVGSDNCSNDGCTSPRAAIANLQWKETRRRALCANAQRKN